MGWNFEDETEADGLWKTTKRWEKKVFIRSLVYSSKAGLKREIQEIGQEFNEGLKEGKARERERETSKGNTHVHKCITQVTEKKKELKGI